MRAVRAVRDWLSNATQKAVRIPGGAAIARRYELFRADLPGMCERLQLRLDELTFNDYVVQVEEWLKLNTRVET